MLLLIGAAFGFGAMVGWIPIMGMLWLLCLEVVLVALGLAAFPVRDRADGHPRWLVGSLAH